MEVINNNLKVIWDNLISVNSSLAGKILSEQIYRASDYADLQSFIKDFAEKHNVLTTTIIAMEDLPANRFINFSGCLCSSVDKVFGVTIYPIDANTEGKIIIAGIVYVEVSSPIYSGGSEIRPSSGGKAQASPLSFQNIHNLDIALQEGELIRIKL